MWRELTVITWKYSVVPLGPEEVPGAVYLELCDPKKLIQYAEIFLQSGVQGGMIK